MLAREAMQLALPPSAPEPGLALVQADAARGDDDTETAGLAIPPLAAWRVESMTGEGRID
jgi:hypothetical protein